MVDLLFNLKSRDQQAKRVRQMAYRTPTRYFAKRSTTAQSKAAKNYLINSFSLQISGKVRCCGGLILVIIIFIKFSPHVSRQN